jgi:perosamine synthetase
MKNVVLVGYSGHALVVYEILQSMGKRVVGYFDKQANPDDPFHLQYLGMESEDRAAEYLGRCDYVVSVGDNLLRERLQTQLTQRFGPPIQMVHPSAQVSCTARLGDGVMVGAQAVINARARIGDGAICNTACVIEHECQVGAFAHVAPGAVLTGNVSLGARAFVGARAVAIPGTTIGENALVGAGTVVISDVGREQRVVGSPARVVGHRKEPSPEPGRIPLSVPELEGNEWLYVKECLDTGWVSSAGRFVERFEQEMAAFVGVKYAVATSCGTAALHLALSVAGVDVDDEVLMPTTTFIASANAVRYQGAWPVFLDVDHAYWQMDPDKLSRFLKTECRWSGGRCLNKTTGRRIAAVMPVHLLGHPCPMDEIVQIAAAYELPVVEDAAEALGSLYKKQMAGSIGDIAALSFNGNKIMTTGGGGMILTNREQWASRARYLSTQARDHRWEYVHNEIGFNYRLTNVAAALGVAQLERMPERLHRKRMVAERYQDQLRDVPGLAWQQEAGWARGNRWLFACLVDPGLAALGSRQLMESLDQVGVEARPIFQPLHVLPPFAQCQAFEVSVADRLCQQALCLPSSAGLTEQRQAQVVAAVRQLLLKK